MKPKVVLFDMDGVLIDNDLFEDKGEKYILKYFSEKEKISYAEAEKKWLTYLEPIRHQKEWHDWRFVCNNLGLGKIWIESHVQNLKHLKLIPGAKDLLENLSKKYKLGIASDAIKEVIDIKLGYFALLRYFDHIFSQDSFKAIKNQEQYFKEILKFLELDPKEIVLVDDRPRGINTAKKLGMHTIHVPFAYKIHRHMLTYQKKFEKPKSINADFKIKRLSEIEGILEILNK